MAEDVTRVLEHVRFFGCAVVVLTYRPVNSHVSQRFEAPRAEITSRKQISQGRIAVTQTSP